MKRSDIYFLTIFAFLLFLFYMYQTGTFTIGLETKEISNTTLNVVRDIVKTELANLYIKINSSDTNQTNFINSYFERKTESDRLENITFNRVELNTELNKKSLENQNKTLENQNTVLENQNIVLNDIKKTGENINKTQKHISEEIDRLIEFEESNYDKVNEFGSNNSAMLRGILNSLGIDDIDKIIQEQNK